MRLCCEHYENNDVDVFLLNRSCLSRGHLATAARFARARRTYSIDSKKNLNKHQVTLSLCTNLYMK